MLTTAEVIFHAMCPDGFAAAFAVGRWDTVGPTTGHNGVAVEVSKRGALPFNNRFHWCFYHLVNVYTTMVQDPPSLPGPLTISTGPFSNVKLPEGNGQLLRH